MKKGTLCLVASALCAGLLLSCGNNTDISKLDKKERIIAMEKLKKSMQSGQMPERLAPFNKRDFKPYLSGEWIGNAVSYGCYREGQAPGEKGPLKAEILEDLTIIMKYWNLVRVYNADDDTERILEVIRENNLPVRMMMGIWLSNETDYPEKKQENINNVLRGIELANRFQDIIIAVNVGNETQVFWSWHRMKKNKLLNYIRTVRNNIHQPVTTADDYNFWNKPEAGEVADEIDFLVTHIYPLWNGKTLDTAIEWMDSTFRDVLNRYPDKQIVLGETGWATRYNAEKEGPGEQGTLIKGKVGLKAQEKYLVLHNEWVNKNAVTTFLFEAFDEPWKGGGENTGPDEVEKNWGVFYVNRTPKESFQNYLKRININTHSNEIINLKQTDD